MLIIWGHFTAAAVTVKATAAAAAPVVVVVVVVVLCTAASRWMAVQITSRWQAPSIKTGGETKPQRRRRRIRERGKD